MIRMVGGGRYGVRVAVVDPPGTPGEAWFVALGFAAWLEDVELARFARLAAAWGRRLVVVETPGTGARTRLSAVESAALLRGRFGPLAERLLRAAREAADMPMTGALGYSLGASVAGAAARTAPGDGPSFESLVLVEPVAVRPWSAPALLRANRAEVRRDAATPVATVGARAPRTRRLDQLLLVNALRSAALGAELAATSPLRVVAVRGTESRLCDEAALRRLERRAEAAGHAVTSVRVAGGHSLWHRPEAVAEVAEQVNRASAR